MAYEKDYLAEDDLVVLPPCKHLRSKAMYVKGSQTDTGDPKDGGNQNTWCNLTQHIIGPDNETVDRIHCVEGRKCHECIG